MTAQRIIKCTEVTLHSTYTVQGPNQCKVRCKEAGTLLYDCDYTGEGRKCSTHRKFSV